jgi:hypothetical protein
MGLSYDIHEHVSSLHSYSWEPRIHGNLAPRHCSNPLATLFVVWDLLGLPCAMGLFPRLLCGLYWACLVRCILVWVISFMGTLHRVIVQTHWQLSLLGLFPRSLRGLQVHAPRPCFNCERNFHNLAAHHYRLSYHLLGK